MRHMEKFEHNITTPSDSYERITIQASIRVYYISALRA